MVPNRWPLAAKLVLSTTLLAVVAVVTNTLLIIRYAEPLLSVEQLSAVRNLGLGMALATAAIGVLLSLLISRSITKPLQEVKAAMQGIIQGDLTRQLSAHGGDELTAVIDTFNAMLTELQEIAAFRGAVLEAIYEGVIIVGQEGRIKDLNRAAERMFGYGRHEAHRMRLTDLILVRPGEKTPRQRITHYLTEGEGSLFNQMIESVGLKSDGTEIPIDWAITRISATEPPEFTIVVHDLTQRKQAEEELRQAKEAAEAANRAKTSFLANMSHELRTPLSAIIGYTELLQEEAQEQGYEGLITDLAKISTAGHQLLDVISDILDLAKIETGKLELSLEEFDLQPLIEEVTTTTRSLIADKEITLHVYCADDIGSIYADRVKVQQILLNLLSNAAKFTTEGAITLAASRETIDAAAWICLRVTDTGIGMDPAQMRRLFQPFVPIDSTVTQTYGGSGLGLAISRTYCRRMGGEIQVESRQGEGSVFTVLLPAIVSEKPSSGDLAGQETLPPETSADA